jgi:hypothetical protein
MNRSIFLAALLLACSCSQSQTGSETANEAADASEAAAPAEVVPALVGEWRVAAIDGRPVDAASAMVATFREGKLQVASGCLRRAWSYTQQRNMVSFTPDPGGSSNCGAPPSGDQENVYAALELATMAIFVKDGSEASLSGNGGTLTLERR